MYILLIVVTLVGAPITITSKLPMNDKATCEKNLNARLQIIDAFSAAIAEQFEVASAKTVMTCEPAIK